MPRSIKFSGCNMSSWILTQIVGGKPIVIL